jgi:hypothetical protein
MAKPGPGEQGGPEAGQSAASTGVVGPEGTAFLAALLTVLAGAIFLSWVFLAAVHATDRFSVGWAQGAWMGLAQAARRGVLYPPLFDGTHFGGTRLMPIPILLMAQLSHLTGGYLEAGKLFSYLSFAVLLGVMGFVLRSVRCPTPVALGLAASVLAGEAGFFVSTGIGSDALPVALQLLAVALVARSARPRSTLVAAGLCAVAFFSKSSALWAPLAIAAWLLWKERRQAPVFIAAFVGLSVAGVVLFSLVTDGRFLTNVVGLSFSGARNPGLLVRPITVIPKLADRAAPASALLPLAAVGLFVAVRRRALTIYHLSIVSALLVLLVVLVDAGADYNHLLDLAVLIAVVVGILAASHVPRTGGTGVSRGTGMSLTAAIVVAVLAWVLVSSFVVTMFLSPGGVSNALAGDRLRAQAARPLAGLVQPGDVILSEDATIPIQLGQRPVVLDPFMLLRIGEDHPEWIDRLVGRIRAREFDKVVLVKALDEQNRSWYEEFHLGPAVFDALVANYRQAANVEGYFVYVPRGA